MALQAHADWAVVAGFRLGRSLEVVQAVARPTKRRRVVFAVGGRRAARASDRGGISGERQNLAALQEPNEAGLIVAGQASIARARVLRRSVQPEQVRTRPTKRLGLLTPGCKKPACVLYGLFAALDRDVVRTAPLKLFVYTTKQLTY